VTSGFSPAIRRVVFEHPLLRGIDERGRAEIEAAARVRSPGAGEVVVRHGEPGDSVFVVLEGQVELSAVRRGDEAMTVVRTAAAGETFGEDALLAMGAPRRLTATARTASRIAQLPVSLLWRGAGRAGAAALAEREMRLWRRRATADLLSTMAATRTLPEAELELLLDAVVHRTMERGHTIYAAGDQADGMYLVVDGLVQLQRPVGSKLEVCAYLLPGDGFGDEESLLGEPRPLSAVAMGQTRLLRLPADALRTVVDRNPGIVQRIRRVETDRAAAQAAVVAAADARSTQHVFHDLYRMQIARSMLVIDQNSCVRCGHCAWTCAEVHGAARLVRRGDKVLTTVAQTEQSLLVVNSCQHCKNPACMIDCPTGAIGRDPAGEVFIRPELCTGCGNCAKACPWENIRMAPRTPEVSGPAAGALTVASKCDLCRDYTAPACVQACPTEAITRLDPSRDVQEVAALAGGQIPGAPRRRGWPRAVGPSFALVATAAASVYGARLQATGLVTPGEGVGWWAGVAAATGIALLLAYALPKRLVGLWLRRRPKGARARTVGERPAPRSRLRPLYHLHLVLGLSTIAAVVTHAGGRWPADPSGSLHAAFWLVTGLGLVAAVCYRVLPPRLARLERVGALPEDLAAQREGLVDTLYRRASGQDAAVKAIVAQSLVPYARSLTGPWRLLASGRSLAQERARLRRRIGGEHPAPVAAALEDLIETVVELRAWPGRRLGSALLRGFVPLHVLATGLLVALLVAHIAVMTGGP
jgi:CRP-like cAMP-binding protein/Fe-S-cluster-containing dehydrogenase component